MRHEIFEKIGNTKVVSICRGIDVNYILPAVEAVYRGGIFAFEITFDQRDKSKWKETYDAIKLLKDYGPSDIVVGAGTVMNIEQLELAVEGGAEFILAPNINVEVIKEAKQKEVLMIPGAFTPTEIANAYDAGADIIKVFPAGLMGSCYIKAIRGPIKHIPLMAVSNINHNNFKEFLEAGCMSVGVGTNIMNPELVKNHEYEKLTELAEKYKC